jgi:hypothetical protein
VLTAQTAANGSVHLHVAHALAQEQVRIVSRTALCGAGATHQGGSTYVATTSADLTLAPCR